MTQFNKIAYFGKLPPGTLKSLSATALRVLMMLYHFSDKEGDNAFPGVAQLARKCAVSESTVKDALKRLKQAGCIEQVSRGGRAGDGRKWASNFSLRVPSTSGESDLDTEAQCPELDSSTSESDFSTSGSEMSTSDSEVFQRPDLPFQGPENRPPSKDVTTKHVTPNYGSTQPSTSEPVALSRIPHCPGCNKPIFNPDYSPTELCNWCISLSRFKSMDEELAL